MHSPCSFHSSIHELPKLVLSQCRLHIMGFDSLTKLAQQCSIDRRVHNTRHLSSDREVCKMRPSWLDSREPLIFKHIIVIQRG